MSVLISGMNMPTSQEEARLLVLFADGHVETMEHVRYEAKAVAPHGDLIEKDLIRQRLFNYYNCVSEGTSKSDYKGETIMNYEVADMIEDCLDAAPVVMMADRGIV